MRLLFRSLTPVALAAALLATPAVAHADTVWLCRPGSSTNPCEGSLKTTVRSFTAPKKVFTPPAATNSAFDCFYVYPTVSEQSGPVSDLSVGPEEISIAEYQAARFSEVCNVYAPIYRQITLSALFTGGASQQDRDIAYADVRTAFEEYRAANPGRPYILIGHSQGSGMLKRLMQEVIEPDPVLRAQMVSALITGSSVSVPVGKTVGGDFKDIPICTRKAQINCVISYATFGQKVPDGTFFGVTRMGKGYEAACTNPAALATNRRAKAVTYVRGEPPFGLMGVVAGTIWGGKIPTAKTPWLRPKDRYTVQCVKSNGAHVLRSKPVGKARKLNPAPTPQWGLHLLDINLPLGNLLDVVRAQQTTYSATPR